MAEAKSRIAHKPNWIDLTSADPAGSRDFYSRVFGWEIDVSPDPQYGGYGTAKLDGQDVAGIGPSQSPDAPTAWAIYIATDDAEELARTVRSAGGTVVAEPFEVGDQGRMMVVQDPAGAFISAWEPKRMRGFQAGAPGSFGWAELNARGVERAIPFYEQVFGWGIRRSDTGDGGPAYTEFLLDDESIAGAWEMNPMVPADVPSYWLVYFGVDDIDRMFDKATKAGARELVAPTDFPGGRFAIVQDPQGASFGLMQYATE